MSNRQFVTNSTNSDNLYFNVQIVSDNTSMATPTNYNITRTRNILDLASDYYVSVVRFEIPSFYVPVLVFQLANPITDNATGVYEISLTYNGVTIREPVLFDQQTAGFETTDPAFYYIYTYDAFLTMLNQAALVAYNQLPGTLATDYPPVFRFDPSNSSFDILVTESYLQQTANRIDIGMNASLFTLFSAFEAVRLNSNNIVGSGVPNDYLITCKNLGTNNYLVDLPPIPTTLPGVSYNVWSVVSNWQATYNWNPFKKIIITTTKLPIESESIQGSGDGTLKILTDFIPDNTVGDVRSVYQYNPQTQYRLVDLKAHHSLRDVDLQFWWQDINNVLNPIVIPPNTELTLKLGFFKKSLYNHQSVDSKRAGSQIHPVGM